MLIRKNTKEHSAITEVVEKYAQDRNRKKLIKLYIVEAGKKLEDKIAVEKTGSFEDVYYNLTLDSVLKNLVDEDHKFHKSEDEESLYYFESNFTPAETPFELAPSLQKEVELLVKDKKFKVRKKKAIVPIEEDDDTEDDKIRSIIPETSKKDKKRVINAIEEPENIQADYELKHAIEFTDLKEIIIQEPTVTKQELLDYYNIASTYMLPFIENAPLLDRDIDEVLRDLGKETPDWGKTANIYIGDIAGEFLLAKNKEHLLFLANAGIIELTSWISRNKNLNNPDFLIIALIPSPNNFEKAIAVAGACKEILDICDLPGFIKTTGEETLELYIPLNGKSDFNTSKKLADLLVSLIAKKEPKLSSIEGKQKGKVYLDTSLNAVGKSLIVPFSLKADSPALISRPMEWEELTEDFNYTDYSIETVSEELKEKRISPEKFLTTRIDVKEVFELLNRRYGFLLT